VRTLLSRADLRGATFRRIRPDRLLLSGALLGPAQAAGAQGTVVASGATFEDAAGRRELTPLALAAWWAGGAAQVEVLAPAI
jgi:hypothetical protein